MSKCRRTTGKTHQDSLNRCFFLVAAIFLLSCLQAPAQHKILRFTRTSLEQGLSQSSVQCIIQDEKGFIWLGTQNGLNRFDGRNIVTYHHDPYTPGSMTNSVVLCMETDDEGRLWIGSMGGGLMIFDPAYEYFHSFSDADGAGRLEENMIWSLEWDRQRQCMWVGTGRGLYCYSMLDQKAILHSGPGTLLGDTLGSTGIMCILHATDGSVWLGSSSIGLIRYFPESGDARVFSHDPADPGSLSDNIVWCLAEDPHGGMWAATNRGLNHLPKGSRDFQCYLANSSGLADDLVWSLRFDRTGKLWIGTNNGLNMLDPATGSFITYRNQPANPYSLSNNVVWSLFEERNGVIMAGTNDGVSSFSPGLTRFEALVHDLDDPAAFPIEPVTAALEDRSGALWVGTDGGGLCRVSQGRCVETWRHASGDPKSISGDHVWSLLEDRNGMIWIGTYGDGLNRMDPITGAITRFRWNPSDPYSLPNDRVLQIYEDRNGILWLGTRGGGLARLERNSGTFTAYLHSEKDSLGISGNTVTSILEDTRGRMWVGTFENGLNLFDRLTGIFLRFRDDLGRPFLVSQADIWNLAEDENGDLWVGTSSGLFHIFSVSLEDQTLSFRHYTTADGLPDNQVIGLLAGNDGNFWISTVKGISCLDTTTHQVKSYDTYDGLQSNEFSQGSFHKGPSGKLYFGGIHGLNAFFPEDIRDLEFQSRVYLTGMKLFYTDVGINMPDDLPIPAGEPLDGNEEVRIRTMEKRHYAPISFFDIRKIELSYKQNVLTFDFAAPEFFKPSKVHYLCRMEGFEDNWNDVGSSGRITYTNLDPGDYILKVQARNGDQVAAREELRLNISITPPLWARPWFMILSILLLLMLVVTSVILVIRRQNLKERREAERVKEMLELQLKSIRSQINPHFTFNAINSIGSFIYSNDPDKTYDYFTKFSKLIRHTLQSTDRLYVPLEEEIDFIRTYLELETVRFKKKFVFTVEVDKRIDPKVMVPKMILHTHTENAIKHGLINMEEGGRLEIRVEQQGNALVFIVRDNGIGRLKSAGISKYSTHRGLKIIEQLFDLHYRIYHQRITQQITDLYDENNTPSGTEVRIMYPVPEEMEIN